MVEGNSVSTPQENLLNGNSRTCHYRRFFKIGEFVRMSHQGCIECLEQGETSLGTGLVDPSTSILDYMHQNLQWEAVTTQA